MRFGQAFLFLGLLGVAFAQQTPNQPGETGSVKAVADYSAARLYGLTPARQQAFTKKLEAVAAALGSAPVFQPPRGFDLWIAKRYTPGCSACATKPVMAEVSLMLAALVAGKSPLRPGQGDAAAFVRINHPAATLYQDRVFQYGYAMNLKDAAGRDIMYQPQQTGEYAGVPIYDNARIILSKGPRPYWIPVTREQFLQALIRRDQEFAAKQETEAREMQRKWLADSPGRKRTRDELYGTFKKSDPARAEAFLQDSLKSEAALEANLKSAAAAAGAVITRRLEDFRAELAALSPEQRGSHAWIGDTGSQESGSHLVPAGSPGARPLITLDPGCLDANRRDSIQLVTIEFAWDPPGSRPGDLNSISPETKLPNARLAEFIRTTDWRCIAALLE